MSIDSEKILAQAGVFNIQPTQPWHRHLVGPVELGILLRDSEQLRRSGLTLATLCDLVLGEESDDRSDEALIAAVARLVRKNRRSNTPGIPDSSTQCDSTTEWEGTEWWAFRSSALDATDPWVRWSGPFESKKEADDWIAKQKGFPEMLRSGRAAILWHDNPPTETKTRENQT